MDFETYLKKLADHELEEKYGTKEVLDDHRKKILVTAGINLNWLGDFLANEKIKWEKRIFQMDEIVLTGMYGELNNILIKRCARDPRNVQQLMKTDKDAKKLIEDNASYSNLPIILREDEDNPDKKYKVLDGMNRMLGKIVKNEEEFAAYWPLNEHEHLPVCEPHLIYDLLRAYRRNAHDEEGKEQLYHALSLLARAYENAAPLLKERFGPENVFEKDIQEIISRVLEDK